MPTVACDKLDLFARLGLDAAAFTDEHFDELCFQFGIELDEVLTEDAAHATRAANDSLAAAAGSAGGGGGGGGGGGAGGASGAGGSRVLYYIAIPANRYDLLCVEGIARALNVFRGAIPPPAYRTAAGPPGGGPPLALTVTAATAAVRPYCVAAVLRGVTFTPARYASFIDLQDKLHANICRRRTLVAIGTHDLDSLAPPFVYDARPPADISFVPLGQATPFRADALMDFYRTNPAVKHIKPYVDIIAGSPVFPVITDSRGVVASLPPIINGEHSKISLATRNVFIECTATDLAKARVVLATVVAMFSEYAAAPFEAEPVAVTYERPVPAPGTPAGELAVDVTPDLAARVATASVAAIRSLSGAPIPAAECAALASRMGLGASLVTAPGAVAAAVAESAAASGITASADTSEGVLRVAVPPTRADVLHEVDVIEDVAIAWGYNRIARTLPKASTTGAQLPVNKLTDHLRRELVGAGYDEALTLALVSRADNYGAMGLADDGRAVVLANPASEEFEVVRTALVPGLLKALAANRGAAVRDGLRLFEVSDVVLLDASVDVGARNERRLAALYTGPTAGFEVVHGLADRVMRVLEVPHRPFAWAAPPAPGEPARPAYGRGGWRYHLEEDAGGDPAAPGASYFPGRGARLVLEREGGERRVVGTLGVLHPRVLAAFELVFPVSVLEMCIEPFVEAN